MIERTFTARPGAQGYSFDRGLVPGMIGFDLGWARSDHHVKWLSVGPMTTAPIDAGDYLIVLRDQDHHGHTITGTVKFEDLRASAVHRSVFGSGLRGESRLRIPHLTSSEACVLTGFLFEYESSDHQLLQIKVHQMANNDHIHVNFGDNDGRERYHANISYAIIPVEMLAQNTIFAQSTSAVRGESNQSRTPGTALLQAFSFRFENGDHHLQRISMDLDNDRILARFRDQDGNDPFSWMVEYVILA